MTTNMYNKAGLEAQTYYVADEDPCGYVTDEPNGFLAAINSAVGEAVQRVLEIKESCPEELFIEAAQKGNLAREMAAKAGKLSGPDLELWSLRIRKVVDSIG